MSTPGNYPPPDPWGGQGGQGGRPPQPQPPYGPPQQPPYGQPQQPPPPPYGQPPQPPYGQPPQPPYGQSPQPPYGQSPYGQPSASEAPTQFAQAAPYSTPPAYEQPHRYPNPSPYGQSSPPGYGPPASGGNGGGNGKKFGIIGLIAVLVAGLLVGGYFAFVKKDSAALTFDGRKLAKPDDVLVAAQSNLATIVKTRHGVSASDTRCYFAVPKTPAAGAKKSDIDHALRCGPVLFVDGDENQNYLAFALTAGPVSDGAVPLTAAKTAQTLDPQAVSASLALKRPDKASAPSGAGGLKVPSPPPATPNFLGVVPLGNSTVPSAPATAVIGSKTGGVRLATLGPIERYGVGDDARSAPDGQKLIAFTVGTALTASGRTTTTALTLRVAVNGADARPVPSGSNPVVIAVPTSATDAALQVTDAGVTQTLSLLTGKPGASNIAVGQRKNHFQTLSRALPLNWHWTAATGAIDRPSTLQVDDATLSYWGLTTSSTNAHPASPANAFLTVDLTYTYKGPPTGGFTAPGGLGPFGMDPAYLSLQLPNGAVIKAKDVSSNPSFVYDVFEVPASFTTGTVLVSGSTRNANGLTFTVSPIVRIPISIAAG